MGWNCNFFDWLDFEFRGVSRCLFSFCSVVIVFASWFEWGSNVTWDIVKHCSKNRKRNITVSSMVVLIPPELVVNWQCWWWFLKKLAMVGGVGGGGVSWQFISCLGIGRSVHMFPWFLIFYIYGICPVVHSPWVSHRIWIYVIIDLRPLPKCFKNNVWVLYICVYIYV